MEPSSLSHSPAAMLVQRLPPRNMAIMSPLVSLLPLFAPFSLFWTQQPETILSKYRWDPGPSVFKFFPAPHQGQSPDKTYEALRDAALSPSLLSPLLLSLLSLWLLEHSGQAPTSGSAQAVSLPPSGLRLRGFLFPHLFSFDHHQHTHIP